MSLSLINYSDYSEEEFLDKLNSLTKYPSIPMYHGFKFKDMVHSLVLKTSFDLKDFFLTEKIDGIHCRILLDPSNSTYLIGSRERWLTCKGDRLFNPSMGIVNSLRDTAARCLNNLERNDLAIYVLYGELYGGNINKASRNYSSFNEIGFRLFDAAVFTDVHLDYITKRSIEEIVSWVTEANLPFISYDKLSVLSGRLHQSIAPIILSSRGLPTEGSQDTLDYLEEVLPYSNVALDVRAARHPEGLIVRNRDRSRIAKLKFTDYRKYLSCHYK